MNFNGYIAKESILHKMNPSLKFLSVCFIIALIFIPFGFFFQMIILIFTLSLYFLAKLPLKKLWNIFVSIIFMAILLTIINWITYKGPGIAFDIESELFFLSKPTFLNPNNYHTTCIDGKWFVQGSMFGGKWIDQFSFTYYNQNNNLSQTINYTGHNGFYKLWEVSGNGTAIIEGVDTGINVDKMYQDLFKQLQNHPELLGKLKGLTSNVDIKGNTYVFAYFYSSPWYGFSSEAISLMLFVSIKIFLMILIVTILTSTTSSVQLTCALEDIMNPLRYLKLPVTEWSTTIALGLRFIPSLLDESNRIMKAQASRGLDFKNGNIKDKLSSLISLVVPLFSIAFKKAAELANAMEARGYNPRALRTRYREYYIRPIDWLIFGMSAMLFGILITLVTIAGNKIFIDAFGYHEVLAIL